jgi:hypothetical protein
VRAHLDLLTGAPPAGHHIDVADPAVWARFGADRACGPAPAGSAVRNCLAGDVLVDLAATAEARHLFVVLFGVPAAELAGFDDWFRSEHAPLLTAVPGWSRARLVAPDAGPVTRAAVHDVADLAALDSPERQRAGATAWTGRVFAGAWTKDVRRHVLRAARGSNG